MLKIFLGQHLEDKLTPWITEDAFKTKVLADNRTGAIPKSSFPNNITNGVFRHRKDIQKSKRLDDGVVKLKEMNL